MSQNCNRINNFFRRNVFCILILIEGEKGNRNLKKKIIQEIFTNETDYVFHERWQLTSLQNSKNIWAQVNRTMCKCKNTTRDKTSLTTRWNGWKSTNLQNWETGLQHYVQRCVSVSVLVVVCQKEQFTWSRTVNLWMKASARTKTLVWSWTQTLENTW